VLRLQADEPWKDDAKALARYQSFATGELSQYKGDKMQAVRDATSAEDHPIALTPSPDRQFLPPNKSLNSF